MCTSLAPLIGYDQAAAIAKEAFASGKNRPPGGQGKRRPSLTPNWTLPWDPMSMTKTGVSCRFFTP